MDYAFKMIIEECEESGYDAECPDCKATQTHTFGSSPFSA